METLSINPNRVKILDENNSMCSNTLHISYEKGKTNKSHVLTSFGVISPTTSGLIIPGSVAKQLLIPNRIEAYLGAMSKWFIGKPVHVNPPKPTASVRPAIAKLLSLVYPTTTMKMACEKNPKEIQINIVVKALSS